MQYQAWHHEQCRWWLWAQSRTILLFLAHPLDPEHTTIWPVFSEKLSAKLTYSMSKRLSKDKESELCWQTRGGRRALTTMKSFSAASTSTGGASGGSLGRGRYSFTFRTSNRAHRELRFRICWYLLIINVFFHELRWQNRAILPREFRFLGRDSLGVPMTFHMLKCIEKRRERGLTFEHLRQAYLPRKRTSGKSIRRFQTSSQPDLEWSAYSTQRPMKVRYLHRLRIPNTSTKRGP